MTTFGRQDGDGTNAGNGNGGDVLGRGIGGYFKRRVARKAILVVAPILILTLLVVAVAALVAGSGDAASDADNLTVSDISRYAKTDVIQPNCYTTSNEDESESSLDGSCGSLIAQVAAQCAGVDGGDGLGDRVGDQGRPTDPKYAYWAKLGEYVDSHQNTGHYNGAYASCTQFVEKVVMATVDKDVWGGGPDDMYAYFSGQGTSSGKWEEVQLGTGEPSSFLQPGDVLTTQDHGGSVGHDWIYVGADIAQDRFSGTQSEFAEANYLGGPGFLPHLRKYTTAGIQEHGELHIFRFVGKADPVDGIDDADIVEGSCSDSGARKPSKKKKAKSYSKKGSATAGTVDAVIEQAQEILGSGYRWHGYNWTGSPNGSEFTCSGVIDYALGLCLNGFNKSGCYEGGSVHTPEGYMEITGASKSTYDLEKGDLAYYACLGSACGHVALYIGNSLIIDAEPNGGVAIRDVTYPGTYIGGGSLPEDMLKNAIGGTIKRTANEEDDEKVTCEEDDPWPEDGIPDSDGDVSAAYKEECVRYVEQVGSDTDYALLFDVDNALLNLLVKDGDSWKFHRVWVIWIGKPDENGESISHGWIGDYAIDHKDPNLGYPSINDWVVVFWPGSCTLPVHLPGDIRLPNCYKHSDGTVECGNTLHGCYTGWVDDHLSGASIEADPKLRYVSYGGGDVPDSKEYWIYWNMPIGTRVSFVELASKPEPHGDPDKVVTEGFLDERQLAIMNTCFNVVPTSGETSAAWLTRCFEQNGTPMPVSTASDMYRKYCDSTDLTKLEPGMLIGTRRTMAIYISHKVVMEDCGGTVKYFSVKEWLKSHKDEGVVRWGWANGTVLGEGHPAYSPSDYDDTNSVYTDAEKDDRKARGVDGDMPEPKGTGTTIGLPAPASDGTPTAAYKRACEEYAERVGSDTDSMIITDCKNALLVLLTKKGGKWKARRFWTIWIGKDNRTDDWEGDYAVQHKDGDCRGGPIINPWFTVFYEMRVTDAVMYSPDGWVHSDGTQEIGMGIHAGWEGAGEGWGPDMKSWDQDPNERRIAPGSGPLGTHDVCLWIYDNIPIGTRWSIVRDFGVPFK